MGALVIDYLLNFNPKTKYINLASRKCFLLFTAKDEEKLEGKKELN